MVQSGSTPRNATATDSHPVQLARIAALLKEQLSRPTADSLVTVAAAHNELRSFPQQLVSAQWVDCLLLVAQFFYISGQTILGLEPAANAVNSARALADVSLLRRALTFHGNLLLDAGNIPAAVETHAEALELSQRLGELLAEGVTWNNLGCSFLYATQYSDASTCLARAIAIAKSEPGLSEIRILALGNLALAALHSEDFESGLSSIRACVSEGGEPSSANQLLHRVTAESHYAKLLLEINDLQGARQRCELAKAYATRACSQRAEHIAAIAEGLYEVYAGKVDIGLSRLQTALERARVMKSTLRDSLIAMVKAYDLCGKPQMALVHLRELLHVTRKSQQERALLHHRLHLKSLGLDQMGHEPVPVSGAVVRARVRAQLALLHRQAIAAELVEDPTGQHVYRVGRLAALLGAELGLDEDTCFTLEMSARLHDIGKIGIPDAILASKNSINPEQRALIRTHTNIGAELLSQSGLPNIQMAVDIARHHHEFWDGSGYPDGIAGGAIPEAARITTLADVYDVLTHARPYKPAWSRDRALAEIRRLRGTRFDPAMADTFIALVERLAVEHQDLDAYLGEEAKESPFIQARQKIAAALEAGRGQPPVAS
jgi:putative two-component system response regulator